MLDKIVTGGQTGVDRAALDAALEAGIACGGWCPRGRRAEDGRIDVRYPLTETPSSEYAQRTEWNVRDSDGTLVLTRGRPTQGTAFTIEVAQRLGRPCLVLDFRDQPTEQTLTDWLQDSKIRILNVAGPREEKIPGIYREAYQFVSQVLSSAGGEASGG